MQTEGDVRRDEGIAHLEAKVRSPQVCAWRDNFRTTIIQMSSSGGIFSADDVRRACPPPEEDPTYNPNMISASFSWAKRQNLIRDFQHGVKSTIASRNSGKNPIYKGNVEIAESALSTV